MADLEKEMKTTTKKSTSTTKKSTTAKKPAETKSTSSTKKTTSAAAKKPAETKSTSSTKKTTSTAAKKPATSKSTASAKTTTKTTSTEKAKSPSTTAKKTTTKVAKEAKEVKEVAKKPAITAEKFEKPTKLEFDTSKLNPKLFASSKIYSQAIFDTIISDRASRRQGTHDVKSRAEVRGGGKKPWRQKGTGRARAGSTRSPIWVGGGRAFGPTPARNYKLKVNKKVRFNAFISALTLLAQSKAVVIDDFKLESISTKAAINKLNDLGIKNQKHILIATNDEVTYKSVANLQNVICVKPSSVSVENLIWADVLVLSTEGYENFEGRIK
ncbi:50S ribosomal protein L4 [Mycoplasmopsis bovis]|uniref:Large ribosomal subunit protein uL4 n=2 Tax=Mycoplasmopsis bovis TaxID=28903 RepID=A0A2N8U2X7_MYCBV|nr:50S ribosomal protein L4 [Mycoplasmopsis bovis]AFM51979.1 50S ribosomal protein [Mycoplasmopsis bovis HB0801]AIA34164.1 50S ribosomal protein [Mycoplasmopsis bovis CQ-W70]AMW25195.1 50S ribosomal protein [Mycoplasmopsis bovis]AMW25823.1 50S ribosomal protein [Mycoplasmopsis bovis]AMW26454.1 50S ribosomal protein [Mycoplasmopsis bovis]